MSNPPESLNDIITLHALIHIGGIATELLALDAAGWPVPSVNDDEGNDFDPNAYFDSRYWSMLEAAARDLGISSTELREQLMNDKNYQALISEEMARLGEPSPARQKEYAAWVKKVEAIKKKRRAKGMNPEGGLRAKKEFAERRHNSKHTLYWAYFNYEDGGHNFLTNKSFGEAKRKLQVEIDRGGISHAHIYFGDSDRAFSEADPIYSWYPEKRF